MLEKNPSQQEIGVMMSAGYTLLGITVVSGYIKV
jgi:hypothetical protein